MRSLLIGFLLIVTLVIPFIIWGASFEDFFSPEGTRDLLESYGGWAWLCGMTLLAADILLPMPATVVMSVLGLIYGPVLGGMIAAAGSFLSGVIPYVLCRQLGKGAARWLIGEKELKKGERLSGRVGGWAVALSRWMPLLPEVVACFAGLVRMPSGKYFAALACGSIPMGFAFAVMGHMGADRPFQTIILSAVVPALLWLVVGRILTRLSVND